MTYPRLSLRVEQALTALMLLSFLLLSKLSSTVCSLSLKTPSFSLPDTLSLFSSCFLLCILTSSISLFLTSLFFHLLLLLCCIFFCSLYLLFCFFLLFFLPFPSTHLSLPFLPFSLSPLLPSRALQELGIAVSRLAQRTGRHMGGMFCNPAGHTTLVK